MSQLASQNGIVIWGILASGSEELKRKFLPVLAKGRTLTCIAITESEAGSDPAMMRTRAGRDGADWIINGSKQFITLGGHSELCTRVRPHERGTAQQGHQRIHR